MDNNTDSLFKATCKFECHIQEALLAMKDEDKCLPWYYPQVDQDARLCSPYEAIKLRMMIDTISNKKCEVGKQFGNTHYFGVMCTYWKDWEVKVQDNYAYFTSSSTLPNMEANPFSLFVDAQYVVPNSSTLHFWPWQSWSDSPSNLFLSVDYFEAL